MAGAAEASMSATTITWEWEPNRNRNRRPWRKTNTCYMNLLPDELQSDILSRVPIKTLAHCRIVCKAWRRLTSYTDFSPLKNNSKGPSAACLIFRRRKFQLVELKTCLSNYIMLGKLPVSDYYAHSYDIEFWGFCNGIVCLGKFRHDNVSLNNIVLNPLNKSHMILPISQNSYSSGTLLSGLGMASQTKQYKIVCVRGLPIFAEVCTLGSSCWRKISEPMLLSYKYIRDRSFGKFLNGFLHWLVYIADNQWLICTFDVEAEKFNSLSLPVEVQTIRYELYSNSYELEVPRISLELGTMRGCLVACSLNDLCQPMLALNVWVMEEYGVAESWEKRFVVKFPPNKGINSNMYYANLVGFSDKLEVLFSVEHRLFVYNLGDGSSRWLKAKAHAAIAFAPTFVSVEEIKAAQDNIPPQRRKQKLRRQIFPKYFWLSSNRIPKMKYQNTRKKRVQRKHRKVQC